MVVTGLAVVLAAISDKTSSLYLAMYQFRGIVVVVATVTECSAGGSVTGAVSVFTVVTVSSDSGKLSFCIVSVSITFPSRQQAHMYYSRDHN